MNRMERFISDYAWRDESDREEALAALLDTLDSIGAQAVPRSGDGVPLLLGTDVMPAPGSYQFTTGSVIGYKMVGGEYDVLLNVVSPYTSEMACDPRKLLAEFSRVHELLMDYVAAADDMRIEDMRRIEGMLKPKGEE